MLAAGSWAGSSEVKVSDIQLESQALKALPTLLGPEHPAGCCSDSVPAWRLKGPHDSASQSSKPQLWLTQVGRQPPAQPAERDGAPLPPLLPASTLRQDFLKSGPLRPESDWRLGLGLRMGVGWLGLESRILPLSWHLKFVGIQSCDAPNYSLLAAGSGPLLYLE